MANYPSWPQAFPIDSNNPIAIRSHTSIWPTWVSPEEMYKNQIEWKPNFRVANPLDFPIMWNIEDALKKGKPHPILQSWLSEEDSKLRVEELIALAWWLPSQIHWKISHNWELLDDRGFIDMIKESIESSDIWDDFKSNLISNLKPGKKFDPSIIHSIYMGLVAVEKAWLLWKNWIIDKSSSVILWHGFAWLRNVENDWVTGWIIMGNKRSMWPNHLTWTLPNMPSPIVANFLGTKWWAPDINTACAAAWYAIETSIKKLLLWESHTVVTWWSDSVWDSLYAMASFWRMWALSRWYENDPQLSSRPFSNPIDWATKWFTLGEWWGIFVLQNRDILLSDWINNSADIVGIWTSNCNPLHKAWAALSSWTIEWQALSMQNALNSAWITAEEFVKEDWVIFAHWTATDAWDKAESGSVHLVFWNWVQVTAPKSITWHPLGWAAAQGMSLAISSMENEEVPGTLHYNANNAMEWLPDIDILSENKKWPVKYIIVNAFWFWGHNVSILLRNPNV